MGGRLPGKTKGPLYVVTGLLLMGLGYNCIDSPSNQEYYGRNTFESGYEKGREKGLIEGENRRKVISVSIFEYEGRNVIKLNNIEGTNYLIRRVEQHYTPANEEETNRIESGIEDWVENE